MSLDVTITRTFINRLKQLKISNYMMLVFKLLLVTEKKI